MNILNILNIPALIGSIVLILFLIKREKDKHDNNPKYNATWKAFFYAKWDDFLLSIVGGQALAYIQEPLYFGVVRWMEWDYDKYVDLYFDSEEAVSFIVGFSATFIIGWLYRYIVKKTSKDVEN